MKRRGIVLVISIVLAVVMIMFVGAAIGLGPANFAAGQNQFHRGQAQRAAESGVQYALAQLHKDPAWRGNANQVTVNTSDLYVVEDNGNVIGVLTAPDGSRSQFRLRFNYNDGVGGGDELPNSAQPVDIPYVSINNLTGGAECPVPRADGPGFSVTSDSEEPFSAPIWSASLAVEGRAGSNLGQLGPANPNPPNLGGTRVVVEGIFQVPDLGPGMQESALMAAAGFNARLDVKDGNAVKLTSKSGSGVPKLRSKGEVAVDGGDATQNFRGDKDREVQVTSGDGTMRGQYDSTRVHVGQEADRDPFYQLVWDDVKKPAATAPKLKAGTYVWWDNGELHYYDMGYAEYLDHITANPQDPGLSPAPLPGNIRMSTDKKKQLILNSSLLVDSEGARSNELNVLLREGAAETPPDSRIAQAGPVTDLVVDQISTTVISRGMLQKFVNISQTGNGRFEFRDRAGNYVGSISWNPDGQGGLVANSDGDLNMVLNEMMMPGMYGGTNNQSGDVQFPVDPELIASALQIVPGKPRGEIDLPGVTDKLTASDVEIVFEGDNEQVVLFGEGDIRLTGGVKGKGGSIVSGGNLRVTGMGADFSAWATSSSVEAVNMYARGDIVFSTLDKKGEGEYQFQDVKLKGIIYAWGDFIATMGADGSDAKWGNLNVDGALIAYGGDPAGKPGNYPGKGHVKLVAGKVSLTFDPAYAGALSSTLPPGYKLRTLSWSNNLR